MYPILCIQDDLEEKVLEARRGEIQSSTGRWLARYLPERFVEVWRFGYGVHYGQMSIAAQLRARTVFPEPEWLQASCPIEFTVELLKLLARELALPNYFLLPADPLWLAFLLTDIHDLPVPRVNFYLRKELDVRIAESDFEPIGRDVWTVGRFVEYAYTKTK